MIRLSDTQTRTIRVRVPAETHDSGVLFRRQVWSEQYMTKLYEQGVTEQREREMPLKLLPHDFELTGTAASKPGR